MINKSARTRRRRMGLQLFAFVAMLVLVMMPLSGTAMAFEECPPPAPDYVRTATYSGGIVYVEWAAVPGASGYTAHIINESIGYWQPITGLSDTWFYAQVPCDAGWYRVKVKASGGACEGLYNEDWFWAQCW